MPTTFRQRFIGLLATTLVVTASCVLLSSNSVVAKGKPGGGNGGGGGEGLTLTGTVYFENTANSDPYTIDSTSIAAQPHGAWGHPSFNLHDGAHWKVKSFDPWFVFDPDNPPTTEFFLRRNLFAVDETDGTEILLAFDPDLDISSAEWTAGDGFIGFVGRKLDVNDAVTEFGLYLAEVAYDLTTGAPTGLVGNPVQVIDYLANGETNGEIPAFSPNLTEVAIKNDANHSLRIYSVDTGTLLREIAFDDVKGSPHWSPDGTAIVYEAWGGIAVIDSDGGNRTVVAESFNNNIKTKVQINVSFPRWSPDSSQIVYQHKESREQKVRGQYVKTLVVDLHIVNRDGSSDTDLTNGEGPLNPAPTGWRN